MKNQIENIRNKIGAIMQERLVNDDFETVTTLGPLLARVQTLQKRYGDMEREILEIESALTTTQASSETEDVAKSESHRTEPHRNGSDLARGLPQTLKIQIDWKANKRNKKAEEICRNTAAATMAAFIGRLVEELGEDCLAKLAQVRINRGPLISKVPAKDFVNQSKGTLYGHQKLNGCDYYILTHSPTSQKVEDLNNICRLLGFVPGSVQIEQVSRRGWLSELVN